MKNHLFLLLLIGLFAACEKEVIEPEIVVPTADRVEVATESAGSPSGATLRGKGGTPPPIVQTSIGGPLFCSSVYLSSLGDITTTSAWTVGHSTQPAYVDYLLDQAYQCSWAFSSCTIRPAGPPQLATAEFWLVDEGYLQFDPILGSVTVYDYLSNAISPSTAEELKDHFACAIKNYQTLYYPTNSYVANVDFFGDATLCTCPSGSARYLKASVTFWLF
ncbi:MAG: hypothetical protein AAGD05_03050 [Bacteroidota bacterium]